jgi:hypothetical protein
MSGDLRDVLRASMDANPPDWLDRLVTDRVVARVERENAAQAAGLPGRDMARAALVALERSGELLQRVAKELLPGNRESEGSPARVLDDPNEA